MTPDRPFNQIPSKVAITPTSVGGRLTYERTGVTSLHSHPLRQEGEVYSQAGAAILTPSVVKCRVACVNMELLTEFAALRSHSFKHGTPDGVQPLTISELHSKPISRKEQNPKTHDTRTLKRFPESN